MPQVVGLCNDKLKWDSKDYRYLKLTEEIKELEKFPYEFFYYIYMDWYGIYFEFDENEYCILLKRKDVSTKIIPGVLFKYENGRLRLINSNTLGEKIYNLCLKFPKIITEQSTDRINFLLNKKRK